MKNWAVREMTHGRSLGSLSGSIHGDYRLTLFGRKCAVRELNRSQTVPLASLGCWD